MRIYVWSLFILSIFINTNFVHSSQESGSDSDVEVTEAGDLSEGMDEGASSNDGKEPKKEGDEEKPKKHKKQHIGIVGLFEEFKDIEHQMEGVAKNIQSEEDSGTENGDDTSKASSDSKNDDEFGGLKEALGGLGGLL